MAWARGQDWRVVESLQTLNRQIRSAYPRAVPPATAVTSWGAIADDAHNSDSDHYPHYYPVLGAVAVVCARDFPHAPTLGLDAHTLADQLRRGRDSRIGYIISNGRITGPHRGWRWDPYSGGSDPHDTHIHVSSVRTAAADDPRGWQIGGDDMGLSRTEGLVGGRTEAEALADLWWATFRGNSLAVEQQALRRVEATQAAILAAAQGLDTGMILARIDQHAQAEATRDTELRGLVEQGLSGQLDAAEVVRLIGERLTGTGS